jgi:IS605 OrfB family transposase
MESIINTFKIELKIKSNNILNYNDIKELFQSTQNLSSKGCNKILLELYSWEVKRREYFRKTENNLNEQNILGKKLSAFIEDCAKELIPYLHTSNVAAMRSRQENNWKRKNCKEVMNNCSQLATFNKTNPIDIHNNCWEIIKSNKGYDIIINFFNRKAEEYYVGMIDYYEKLIEKERKNNKENKKVKIYENKLQIYKNILNYVKQKNNKLVFSVDKISGSVKSIINNIINYNKITLPLNKEKEEIKKQKQKFIKEGNKLIGEELKKQMDNKTKEILNKLNEPNTCKQGAGQLKFNTKDGKFYFYGSFTFIINNKSELNKNRILGIDLGIINVATLQIWDMIRNNWDKLSWKECKMDGKELIHFRQKIEARKRSLQISSKWAGIGRIGHGHKTKMKSIIDLGDTIARFRDTYNYKIRKYIINIAKKYNCGVIQMENLSGFSEIQSESILKNWSYYDLQNKIKNECDKQGIEFKLINPQYTSKRCSNCGCIHPNNRDNKNNAQEFKCISCGHKENADINAAKNISLPNIEEIIEIELKNKEERMLYNDKI